MSRRTTTARSSTKDFLPAKKTVDVTVGESVRIIRELQELSQNELAALTGIPQSAISAVENDRVNLARHYMRAASEWSPERNT